jgi:hypothetical protein
LTKRREKKSPPGKPNKEAKPEPIKASLPRVKKEKTMPPTLMNLKVLLPFQVFAEKTGVSRIVAETREGSFGLCRTDSIASRRSRPGF